mgnify:CR=1 FL=1
MSTVQANLAKLAQRIDPYTSAGVEITAANVCTVGYDGQQFTIQRLLDIYNEARLMLFNELRVSLSPDELSKKVSKTAKTKTDLKFASGVTPTPASDPNAIPADFIEAIGLTDNAGARIYIVKPSIGPLIADANANGTNPHLKESATNRFVVLEGGGSSGGLRFRSESANVTWYPNVSTYKLRYFGVGQWTLTTVTTGTQEETFGDDYLPRLLEFAAKVSLEQGMQEVNALAKAMGGG